MSTVMDQLKRKLAEQIGWERRKRHEQICAAALGAAFALALLIFPLHVLLPIDWLRWLVPVFLFGALAPCFFYRRRWACRDASTACL